MNPKTRTIGAILAASVLFGCAANSGIGSKPPTAAVQDPNCVTATGSNFAAPNNNCSAFGRAYSQQDMQRTGKSSAGEALAILDPSITVHR